MVTSDASTSSTYGKDGSGCLRTGAEMNRFFEVSKASRMSIGSGGSALLVV